MEKKIKLALMVLGVLCCSIGAALYSAPAGLIIFGLFLLLGANRDKLEYMRQRNYKVPE